MAYFYREKTQIMLIILAVALAGWFFAATGRAALSTETTSAEMVEMGATK